MRLWSLALVALAGCGPTVVAVLPDGAGIGTSAAPSDPSFEVIARSAGVKDPLPVGGAGVSYANLEPALAKAVLRNVRPRHASTLTVELISADADYSRSRVAVSIVARATLRAREGNEFIAQTQVICRDSSVVAAEQGAPVVWSCMTRLGRDIAGWLDGVPSTTPANPANAASAPRQ
jgi:hypothetical protein